MTAKGPIGHRRLGADDHAARRENALKLAQLLKVFQNKRAPGVSALLLMLLAAALAQGCGFHLRGHAPTARAEQAQSFSVYLRVADASPLAAELRSQLAVAKVKIRDSMEGADYALSVYGENFKQTALSVSPTTGKVEEYQIVFTLRVSISRADGELLVDNQALRVFRDYTFDEEAALGKFVEEEGLREELLKQVVAQIIRQLSTVANRR